MSGSALENVIGRTGARFAEVRALAVVTDFGDPLAEYAAATTAVGLYPVLDRALIEVAGADRTSWLHNLVTNDIRRLLTGDGSYTFAVSVKGRILMDFNVLARQESFWLDTDRRHAAAALTHFDRYTITEDVQVRDLSAAYARLMLVGPKAAALADQLHAPDVAAMSELSELGSTTVMLAGRPVLLFRHDLAGLPGLELCVPAEVAVEAWLALMDIGQPVGLRPVGRIAVRTLQIESGIPVWGEEIDGDVLPAETLQLQRAVSFNKGCFVGYEVIERMRSRHSLPRKLVGLRLARLPAEGSTPVPLQVAGKTVGRLMSFCHSPAVGSPVGLGYLATTYTGPGMVVAAATDPPIDAEVVPLPFHSRAC